MSQARAVIVADVLAAEPDSGPFMRVWRTVAEEPVDWLTPVRWTGQWLAKIGGQVFPADGDGSLGDLTLEAMIRKIGEANQIPASGGLTIFMGEMDAYGLLPEMVTPRVPLDLTDISVNDVAIDLVVGRLGHSLTLPPIERSEGSVTRSK